MSNGSNDWSVSFSRIDWLDKLLRGHPNVACVKRDRDIYFSVKRKEQGDNLFVLCCDEYAAGMAIIQRGLSEFGEINIFHIGGGWNGYTPEAKQYCLQNRIGLYVSDEMSGALWKNEYWNYHKRDDDGNPTYFYRSA
jgi:hypothetical protein